MRRFVWRFIWPAPAYADALPPIGAPGFGHVVAGNEAQRMLSQQLRDYDALDSKAATVIGASFVVVALVMPNLRIHTTWQGILFAALAALLAHALLTAVRGYGVSQLHGGVDPESLVRLAQATAPEGAAALGYMTVGAYVFNKPIMVRKGQFLQFSLRSLALALVPLVLLYVADGFSVTVTR